MCLVLIRVKDYVTIRYIRSEGKTGGTTKGVRHERNETKSTKLCKLVTRKSSPLDLEVRLISSAINASIVQ